MLHPKTLTFDVFGGVVDILGSLLRDLSDFGKRRGIDALWDRFADAWVAGYGGGILDVGTTGQWKTVDVILRESLDKLVSKFNLPGISESDKRELTLFWRQLKPWDDCVEGLRRLRESGLRVVTLANGNVSLLADLSCNAGIVWDEILSAQFVQRYKPDPAVYQMAINQLQLPAEEIMMVAAHKYDLDAAREAGFQTAFVWRPLELGPGGEPDHPKCDDPYNLSVKSLLELADALAIGPSSSRG
jgi:2-haloacid dehalogenase